MPYLSLFSAGVSPVLPWQQGSAQCIGGLLPLILFLGKNDSLLHLVPTRLEWSPFFLSCTNGMSELMGNISASIVSMLYNFQLLNYAGENGIAAYGVLMYVQFIFIAVFFGYTIGVGPVIGYHYGAGNHAELKNLLRKSLKLNIITGISMTILANHFRPEHYPGSSWAMIPSCTP